MSSNPSIQCSVCGQWKRLHGKDDQGIAIQRFYSCCGENGECIHEREVCDDCCTKKCPYRMKKDLAQRIYLALNAEGLPVYDIHKPIIQKVLDESPDSNNEASYDDLHTVLWEAGIGAQGTEAVIEELTNKFIITKK